MKVNECSGRALAFLGDAVWSLAVRKYLLEKGEGKGKELQTVHFLRFSKITGAFLSGYARTEFSE